MEHVDESHCFGKRNLLVFGQFGCRMAAVAQRDQPLHEPYYGVIEEHIHQDQAGQHKRVGEVEAAYE